MGTPKRQAHPIYSQSPVNEALVAFFFKGSREQLLDPTFSGRFWMHPKIQEEYPKTLLPQGHRVRLGSLELESEFNQIRFQSGDGKRLLILMPGVLSVHQLRPYETWDVFRTQVERALGAYTTTSNMDQIQRVGVRYINTWQVGGWEEAADHLDQVGKPLCLDGSNPSSLVRRQEYRITEHEVLAVHQACSPQEIGCEVSLDLDAGEHYPEGCSPDAALEHADRLHERVYEVFEKLITDKAREAFT